MSLYPFKLRHWQYQQHLLASASRVQSQARHSRLSTSQVSLHHRASITTLLSRHNNSAYPRSISTQRPSTRTSTITAPSTLPKAPGPSGPARTATMADDASYMSFLNKANESTSEPSANQSTTKSSVHPSAEALVTTSAAPPAALSKQQYIFSSESDEPFEAVSLTIADSASGANDGDLSEESFASVIPGNHGKADIERVEASEFERMGYGDVLAAVREAVGQKGKGVSVFRVKRDHARVEWWVVGVKDGVLLGLRAKAVET